VRRLGRILLNFLTTLSVLLLLAAGVLWVRSVHHAERIIWGWRDVFLWGVVDTDMWFESRFGRIVFQREVRQPMFVDAVATYDVRDVSVREHRTWEYQQVQSNWNHDFILGRTLGFEWRRMVVGSGGFSFDVTTAVVPYCWVLLAGAALPGVRLLRALRGRTCCKRRRFSGLCLSCGYDLRATPDRCPECGADASPADSAKGRPA
jgi:hypothetical protein